MGGLRIIGGRLKGRRLVSVPGNRVRPTSDRLRETIFNIIRAHVPESRVLDLFAGTGALGMEALSRGAVAAVFVEKSRSVAEVIKKNITTCEMGGCATVQILDAARRPPLSGEGLFDLVFVDPPYKKGFISPALAVLARHCLLAEGCLLVAEHGADETVGDLPAGYRIYDQRRYGKTGLTFMIHEAKEETASSPEDSPGEMPELTET